MAAESGGTKKPPRSTKAPTRKPAKRATAASGKTAKRTPAAAGKAAKGPSTARPTKPRGTSTASGEPAEASSAASKPKRASTARKPRKRTSATAKGATPESASGSGAADTVTPAAPEQPASVEEVKRTRPASASAKRAVVEGTARSYFDALAARDVAAAAAAWSEDGVDDIVPFGLFRGPAAIRSFLEQLFAAMPDARFSVERVIADESAAAIQWRIVGTFSGADFQGLAPTGSRIELRGIDNLEIADGKIVHGTGVFDGAAFARQIGLLPAEDSSADRAIRAGFNTVTKLRRSMMRRAAG